MRKTLACLRNGKTICVVRIVNERKNEVAKTGKGPNMMGPISQDKYFRFYSKSMWKMYYIKAGREEQLM